MNKILPLVLAFGVLFCTMHYSLADEPVANAPSPEVPGVTVKPRWFEIAVIAGPALAVHESVTAKRTSGSTVGSDSRNFSNRVNWGAEFMVNPPGIPILGLGGAFSAHSGDNFTAVEMLFVPKLRTSNAGFSMWAGLGLGYFASSDVKSSLQSMGIDAANDMAVPGVAVSPRFGLDYDFVKDLFLGMQAAYTLGFGAWNTSGVVGGSAVSLTNEVTTSWFSLSARLGFRF